MGRQVRLRARHCLAVAILIIIAGLAGAAEQPLKPLFPSEQGEGAPEALPVAAAAQRGQPTQTFARLQEIACVLGGIGQAPGQGVRSGVGGGDALADLDRFQQRRVKEDVAGVVKGGLVLPRAVDGDREQAFLDPVDEDLLRDGSATTDGNRGFAPEDIGHLGRVALLQLLLVDPVVAQ
jgi:hypothetical protein